MIWPKISGIYKITSPSNRVYIGKSIDCERRLRGYANRNAKISQRKLFYSIQKYGWSAHRFEIICEAPPAILSALEIFAIALYKATDKNRGLNLTFGGEGGIPTEESRRLRSEVMTGRVFSDEHRQKLRDRMFTEETRQRMSESAKVKDFSASHRESMRKAQLGRKHPDAVKKKIGDGQRGEKANNWGSGLPVLQFAMDGTFIKRFTSANSVKRETGIPAQNIQVACRMNVGCLPSGRKFLKYSPRKPMGQYTARGYIWKYE